MNDFELPAPEVFGPQCEHVVALIERARRLTPGEVSALGAAWDAMLDAAWDAAVALVVRDLITTEEYNTLTRAWREAIGPIHPDDPEMRQP